MLTRWLLKPPSPTTMWLSWPLGASWRQTAWPSFILGSLLPRFMGPSGSNLQSLADYLYTLIALQHPHQHPGVHVAAVHHGHLEFEVSIRGIGGVPAHVDIHAGGSGVGTYGAHTQGVFPG